MRPREIASVLIAVTLLPWMIGCSETQPSPTSLACKDTAEPGWVDDPLVGMSRLTASGHNSDQKKIALQRAIVDLLMTKGKMAGNSEISLDTDLLIRGDEETYSRRFSQDSHIDITYEMMDYSIKVKDIWRDPCTEELYIRIEED